MMLQTALFEIKKAAKWFWNSENEKEREGQLLETNMVSSFRCSAFSLKFYNWLF